MAKVKRLFKIALFLVCSSLSINAWAYDATVDSISPSAEDVSTEIPPLPSRLLGFGWTGTANTTYTISFTVSDEPSLVVGVGAKIQSSQFGDGILTLTVLYEGKTVLTNSNVILPDNSFLIILDPGIDVPNAGLKAKQVRKNSRPRIKEVDTTCYGPGRDISIFEESDGGDFGDDDGLLDPPTPNDVDTTIGLPSATPGSFVSTLSFFWCITPSSSGNADFGFKSLGPKSALDEVEIFLSESYLDYLSGEVNEALSAINLALFSNAVQVSIDIIDSNNGVFTDVELPFVDGSTDFSGTYSSSAPTSSDNLITREFSFGLREDLSLAPDDFTPSTSEIDFFGFVGEPELIGELVEIVRFDQRRQSSPFRTNSLVRANATQSVVIAREVVQPNGSYSASVPSSAVFPNNARRATLGARIPSEQVQQSRQVSLTNRARNQRR